MPRTHGISRARERRSPGVARAQARLRRRAEGGSGWRCPARAWWFDGVRRETDPERAQQDAKQILRAHQESWLAALTCPCLACLCRMFADLRNFAELKGNFAEAGAPTFESLAPYENMIET